VVRAAEGVGGHQGGTRAPRKEKAHRAL